MTNVTVIGLGAMGGGMALSLLRCDDVNEVSGFDLNPEVVKQFYTEAKELGKTSSSSLLSPPKLLTLDRFVERESTDVVLIVLVNEAQCQSVCFDNDGVNLESLLRSGSTVIVSSTVTPTWSKQACSRFAEIGIIFLDCPVSGGPVRALAGEITIMASGEAEALAFVDPLFQAMAKEIHIIQGGAGMGSTVKMVHQLLAGVHIAVAAEALALAAKAGLDVRQLYDIVKGAAGASWMFCDRGMRMIEYTGDNPEQEKVMSSLAIFIKDMDIVYSSAKSLRCPVPIATAALQQFIGGSGLGLDKNDDSQVVKVYETLSGVSVSASSSSTPPPLQTKSKLGDIVVSNEYTRVVRCRLSSKDTARPHKHSEDSLYFFLADGVLDFVNNAKSCDPASDRVEFREVRYETYGVTNIDDDKDYFYIDAQILRSPPVTSSIPLVAKHHQLIKTRDRCRMYRIVLEPGQSIPVNYRFFYLSVVTKRAKIKTEIIVEGQSISWEKVHEIGDVEWNTPSVGSTITNTDNTFYEQCICEWC
mmetsp:Transcript_16004/g.18267  ORF Transcript_16004/g.18267 Transcript_16004/m.18267 type:complete len:529 (+) Transcript_16004:3-1589(+)